MNVRRFGVAVDIIWGACAVVMPFNDEPRGFGWVPETT